jgi:hypothetical protein
MMSNDKIESPSPRVPRPPPYAHHALKVGLATHIDSKVDKRS